LRLSARRAVDSGNGLRFRFCGRRQPSGAGAGGRRRDIVALLCRVRRAADRREAREAAARVDSQGWVLKFQGRQALAAFFKKWRSATKRFVYEAFRAAIDIFAIFCSLSRFGRGTRLKSRGSRGRLTTVEGAEAVRPPFHRPLSPKLVDTGFGLESDVSSVVLGGDRSLTNAGFGWRSGRSSALPARSTLSAKVEPAVPTAARSATSPLDQANPRRPNREC
jgi:hypothetical protein